MINKLSELFKSEYASNISVQLIGTSIAQLIPLLASPILARLYDQESFANLTLFMAVVGVLTVPNGGRYFYAIILPEEERDANDLGLLSIYITAAYGMLLLIFTLLGITFLNNYYGLGWLWYVVPLYVTLFGVYNTLLFFSIRKKNFRQNAIAKISQTTGSTSSSMLYVLAGWMFSGLIIGKITGLITSIFFLKIKPKFHSDIKALGILATRYKNYPVVTILPAMLDVFSVQALIFFVGKFYSEETLGFLGLTNILLVAPIALIGTSFKDVFYQRITVYFNERNRAKGSRLFYNSALVLAVLGFTMAMILFFFGEFAFTLIFGREWNTSGTFAKIISFSIMAKLVASPLSSIFNATNQLKLLSSWQITYFCTTITTLYLTCAYFALPIEETLLIYTLHEFVLYGFYFFLETKALRNLNS